MKIEAGITTELDVQDITAKEIEAAILRLADTKLSWWSRGFIFRTLRHTVAWAKSYLSAEAEELDAEYVSDVKNYHVVMVVHGSQSIRFNFRLTTKGLSGWTEYGIEIRKVGPYFACKE